MTHIHAHSLALTAFAMLAHDPKVIMLVGLALVTAGIGAMLLALIWALLVAAGLV